MKPKSESFGSLPVVSFRRWAKMLIKPRPVEYCASPQGVNLVEATVSTFWPPKMNGITHQLDLINFPSWISTISLWPWTWLWRTVWCVSLNCLHTSLAMLRAKAGSLFSYLDSCLHLFSPTLPALRYSLLSVRDLWHIPRDPAASDCNAYTQWEDFPAKLKVLQFSSECDNIRTQDSPSVSTVPYTFELQEEKWAGGGWEKCDLKDCLEPYRGVLSCFC